MTNTQRRKAWAAQRKAWAEMNIPLSEGFSRSLFRYCSLAKNGYRGKGQIKSQGKITVRMNREDEYQGGSRIYTQQDGWHNARSWVKKKKFQ